MSSSEQMVKDLLDRIANNPGSAAGAPNVAKPAIPSATIRPDPLFVHELTRELGAKLNQSGNSAVDIKNTVDKVIAESQEHVEVALRNGRKRATKMLSERSLFKDMKLDRLATPEGVFAAISLLSAGLSMAGAYSNFRDCVEKDEHGKSRINMSQVGYGIINTAFALGSAYLAHHMYKQAPAPATVR